MSYKISAGQLKGLIRNILTEADESQKQTGVSLDAQVDKYLIDYESEAKLVKNEGYSLRAITRRLLSEVDEDEDKNTGGTLTIDDIDIESFTNDLMRLINNYDSLLEVRNTITKRAKNFLSKNYDLDVIEMFENTLKDQHGIVIDKSEYDIKDEEYPAPPAERAGGTSGGGT